MKTLLLDGGDLVVGPTGHTTVDGSAKVRQDLQLALTEPFGFDRFHPSWGSTAPLFVGQVVTAMTALQIEAEVTRVLLAYISEQREQMYRDQVSGSRSRFSAADVVDKVTSVQASIYQDTVRIVASLATQARTTITIDTTVAR